MTEDDSPVDFTAMRTVTEGDTAMEQELIRVLVVQSDENLGILREHSVESGQNTLWSEAAHMLKGGTLGIGAKRLAGLCNQAQHLEGTAQERTVLLEKIDCEYTLVKDYLRKVGLLQ